MAFLFLTDIMRISGENIQWNSCANLHLATLLSGFTSLTCCSCLLVAQVNERVFVLNANQSLLRFQMLNLKHIPNEEWTYINCSMPLNEAFEAWSMTATIDGILLSGLLDISALQVHFIANRAFLLK